MNTNRKTLGQLFVPICFETLFYMLAGMTDTLMLSSVSDQAVGAVGTANTYIGMFIIMFSVISTGMMAVMTQNIGANKPGIAYQARQIGVGFNAALGILLSMLLFFGGGIILSTVGIADSLQASAESYLKIVGGCCFLNALIPVFAGYLRAFGFMHQSLIATVIANVLNLCLNAVFLFIFDMGVVGVAVATVISKLVNLIIVFIASHILVKAKEDSHRLPAKEIFSQIIKIGFPSALESALYNFAMTLMIRFLNQMDAEGLNVTARSYTSQITNFSYCIAAALAQANAIMTGWRIGAKEFDACDKATKKAALIGIAVTILVASIFALCAGPIMKLFSDDPQMVELVGKLLAIDIILEIGRSANLVFGTALKTSGDAVFPVVIAAIFMFSCAVGGTYFFGIHMGLMAVGAYIGLAMDECVRAIAMFLRWQSGKWRTTGIVQ
uniref:MATE family efflux transporter n=1 Tax=Agathobacter sp. TaxID=2021311 RepID=UPI004057705F